MRPFLLLCLLLAGITTGAQKLTSGGKLKPEQAVMDVKHYTIALTVDTAAHSISGYTNIDIVLQEPAAVLLFDLMNELQVSRVWINNKPAAFSHTNAMVRITPAQQLAAGRAAVKIQYAGKPHIAVNPPWDDGFTWTQDSTGHTWLAITAEGTGGKIYYPCKDHPSDEPDEGADLLITVPKNLVVAGPGLLQGVKQKGGSATYHWKTTYTINNYSILFNVGNYKAVTKTYTTVNGTKVPMQFYVLAGHAQYADHHLDMLAQMAQVQEKYFGEYPWAKEKIGIVETPHLGMEHQTMNAYGNKFRYVKVGNTDFDWLMYHEFGHEWWGNKVTAIDWADFWIHEGICSFGDALYIYDKAGEQAYTDHFKNSLLGIENKLPIVQGKDLDEETAYIGDIYSKGAFFMHTLRYVLGDDIFFPAIKKLATDSAYTYSNFVNTDKVEQLFSQAAGTSVKPLFDFYLRTTQKLDITIRHTGKNTYTVTIPNAPMQLPLEITTDKGVQKMLLGKEAVTIKSTVTPTADENCYYLKRVILE
ncbi:M1 family metallopeptidase [Panacibacter sp. DH6]|uniref:Aminopeptidase N n=1 Tax=Panacibacter microcysteis TaxID=2793269 RepID=A0A931E6K8_9BACT|nr:M1 family metallopeptidase [Panacibacter microcysteis]MBG9376013.1 M1 family metallopeptidase [Panacibacter microcysteis]